MRFKDPNTINPITQMTKDWKRTYDGLLSLHLINNQLIGVRHNEHVNHEYSASWTGTGMAYVYPNTVQNVSVDRAYIDAAYQYSWPTGCRSGFNIPHYTENGTQVNAPGVYDQCWDSFQNFVSLVQIDTQSGNWIPEPSFVRPEDDSSIHDQGPIIWPDYNYRGDYDGLGHLNGWRSSGFYLPTSFVDNGYIYTFYKKAKWGGYCTGAARAPISNNGAAGTWQSFSRARGTFDIPTLPTGFTKENIRNFYDTKTGYISDCIVDENDNGASQPQYFNVARIRGSQYFLAVEERSNTVTGIWSMGIRISTDLINWSPLEVLSSCNGPTSGTSVGWGCGQFAYPTFLDSGATTNYEIDPDEFYILGMHATGSSGYELNAMKLSITVPGVQDKSRLLAMQYYKELLGWTVSYNDSGVIWHAQNIRANGCKADVLDFSQAQDYLNRKMTYSNTDFITMLYRAILSRNPEQTGLDWYIDQLLNQGKDRDWVLNQIVDRPEAQAACNQRKLLILSGDLDGDNDVDIFDYNLLVTNFGNPYTIFDYNVLVGNFGSP